MTKPSRNLTRRAIQVYGTVQGVGFRPFVFKLARRLALGGFVRNGAGNVQIEIEGTTTRLDEFCGDLGTNAPSLARIDRVAWQEIDPCFDDHFSIAASDGAATDEIDVVADAATCDDCLRDLFDPNDRRYRYPFLNCTDCGPRLTIIAGAHVRPTAHDDARIRDVRYVPSGI